MSLIDFASRVLNFTVQIACASLLPSSQSLSSPSLLTFVVVRVCPPREWLGHKFGFELHISWCKVNSDGACFGVMQTSSCRVEIPLLRTCMELCFLQACTPVPSSLSTCAKHVMARGAMDPSLSVGYM
jgi:hypothetical protein